jgi:AraC family transcriptional regulator, transcriptional activator of pobA
MRGASKLNKSPHFKESWSIPDMGTTFHVMGIRLRCVNSISWNFPSEEHMQYEVSLILEGDRIVTINGTKHHQQAGDLIVIKPGMTHSCSQGKSTEFTHFYFHFDIDDKILNNLLQDSSEVLFPAASAVARRVCPILEQMAGRIKLEQHMSYPDLMQFQSRMFEFFAGLGESLALQGKLLPHTDARNARVLYEMAEKIKTLARKSMFFNTQEGIGAIIRGTGISKSHCNRVFQKAYGMSPRRYLSNLMLHEAIRLLENDLRISQISNLLGYSDIAHFSQQFKRWTGLSPSEYRRIHLSGKQINSESD